MNNNSNLLVELLKLFEDHEVYQAYNEVRQLLPFSALSRTTNEQHEKIITQSNLLPANFMEIGAKRQKSVAKVDIDNIAKSDETATGFLISPNLFMTNHHVIDSVNTAHRAKAVFNYQVKVDGTNAVTYSFQMNPEDFFYTNRLLDFTIVRLSNKDSLLENENCKYKTTNEIETILKIIKERIPSSFESQLSIAGDSWGYIKIKQDILIDIDNDPYVNIIQHPRGRRKEIAIQDNKIKKYDQNTLYYTTDTEAGSSGSPVFNNQWQLIALHRASAENEQENRGTLINSIISDLRREFSSSQEGRKTLNEIGI